MPRVWSGAVRVVTDEIYERFVDQLAQAKKAKTFKSKMFGEAGDCISVYCCTLPGSNEPDFFCKNKGIEQLILKSSDFAVSGHNDAGSYIELTPDEVHRRQLNNHTGNHKGKVHGVKVPTVAGQPVRG